VSKYLRSSIAGCHHISEEGSVSQGASIREVGDGDKRFAVV
jgi:hypothetical protein